MNSAKASPASSAQSFDCRRPPDRRITLPLPRCARPIACRQKYPGRTLPRRSGRSHLQELGGVTPHPRDVRASCPPGGNVSIHANPVPASGRAGPRIPIGGPDGGKHSDPNRSWQTGALMPPRWIRGEILRDHFRDELQEETWRCLRKR